MHSPGPTRSPAARAQCRPDLAIRQEVILDPDQTATIDLVTGAAAGRDTRST